MTAVAIVGGGLAGMIAAYELSKRGVDVTIFEGSNRLGGKAGSNTVDGRWEDHGFHIFPMWYVNIWRIVDELGIRGNFVPLTILNQLKADEFPKFTKLVNMAAINTFLQNIFSGVMPPSDMFLFYYTGLDLMSQAYNKRDFLDQISFSGFVRSRFYRNLDAELEFQDLLLKVASAPTYRFSAMTMQKLLRFWMQYPAPIYNILNGSLQEKFIIPIANELEKRGCKIHLNTRLEKFDFNGKTITKLYLRDTTTDKVIEHPVDRAVFNLQPIDLRPMLTDDMYNIAPELFEIEYLDAEPMASLNIYTKERIPNLPREHVTLTNSQYQISFIDISQTWHELKDKPGTVLNVVASDYFLLKNVSPQKDSSEPNEASEKIIEEMRKFIPKGLEPENIVRTYMQPHLAQPLFMNYTNAWTYRPHSNKTTGFDNLYLAGDYCRTWVDLATLEGATESGLRAAKGVVHDAGIKPAVQIIKIKEPSRHLLLAGKWILLPAAIIAWLWSTLVLGERN